MLLVLFLVGKQFTRMTILLRYTTSRRSSLMYWDVSKTCQQTSEMEHGRREHSTSDWQWQKPHNVGYGAGEFMREVVVLDKLLGDFVIANNLCYLHEVWSPAKNGWCRLGPGRSLSEARKPNKNLNGTQIPIATQGLHISSRNSLHGKPSLTGSPYKGNHVGVALFIQLHWWWKMNDVDA